MYERKFKHENLEKFYPELAGKYEFPVIKPVNAVFTDFIGFNSAKTCKEKQNKAVHFYLDDYQFQRLWNYPQNYIKPLGEFSCVLSPDFSLYTDFPVVMQMYNHYKKHWVAAYWQSEGLTVIPTICWSDKNSLEWCFDGEPVGSTVSVSAIGTQNNADTKKAFKYGYDAMIERLQPENIIFYGGIPEECKGNIIRIKSYCDLWKEARTNDFN